MRFKVQDAHDAIYTFYYTEAVEEGIEWTNEHDKFVDEVTTDFIRYIHESVNNFFNYEAPTIPGLKVNNDV